MTPSPKREKTIPRTSTLTRCRHLPPATAGQTTERPLQPRLQFRRERRQEPADENWQSLDQSLPPATLSQPTPAMSARRTTPDSTSTRQFSTPFRCALISRGGNEGDCREVPAVPGKPGLLCVFSLSGASVPQLGFHRRNLRCQLLHPIGNESPAGHRQATPSI